MFKHITEHIKHIAPAVVMAALLTSCSGIITKATWAGPPIKPGDADTTLAFLAADNTYRSKSGATKPLTAASLQSCPTGNTRVTGCSQKTYQVFSLPILFGWGKAPSLKSAYNDAIEKAPGAIALKDVVITHYEVQNALESLLLLLLTDYSHYYYEITATPVYPN